MTDRIADIIKRCELIEDIDRRLPAEPSAATVLAADCRWLMLREAAQRQEIFDLRYMLRRAFDCYDNPAVGDERELEVTEVAKMLGLVWNTTVRMWVEKV